MKLILKNSTILFQNKNYQELSTVSVLNTPTSFFVLEGGSAISTGGTDSRNNLYVNVYQVTAGTTYYVKSTTVQSGNVGLVAVGIAFGTNLLTGSGSISNSILLKRIDTTTVSDFNIEFTPSQNGYVYITEIDYRERESPVACLSSVFE